VGNASILVVEDEPSIAEVVSLYLRRAGYQVTLVADGQAALDNLARQLPDLLVLDVMLPKVDGYAVARWLRDRSDVPIIMLTARREEADRIAGLKWAPTIMWSNRSARRNWSAACARCCAAPAPAARPRRRPPPLAHGDLHIDAQTRLVTLQSRAITLTAKEFDLLYWLARHPRQVFTRDQLLETIWGQSRYIDPSTVTVHIRRLRQKIEPDPSNPARLLTVWGVGYKFEP
jgi:DNA-binding response OmpR family regulator